MDKYRSLVLVFEGKGCFDKRRCLYLMQWTWKSWGQCNKYKITLIGSGRLRSRMLHGNTMGRIDDEGSFHPQIPLSNGRKFGALSSKKHETRKYENTHIKHIYILDIHDEKIILGPHIFYFVFTLVHYIGILSLKAAKIANIINLVIEEHIEKELNLRYVLKTRSKIQIS